MKTFVSLLVSIILLASAAAGQSQRYDFRGTVGEGSVSMTLFRDGRKLTGSYAYSRVGKPLNLSGSLDGDGGFVINETVGSAKTGTFEGKWTETEEDGVSLSGTWKNVSGSKSLDFSLGQQMVFFKGAARLGEKSFVENSRPKLYEISAFYPVLEGVSPAIAAGFNRLSQKLVMDEVVKFRKDMLSQTAGDVRRMREMGMKNTSEIGYTVMYADDEVISISFGNYVFTGGAHGSGYSFVLNFDLRTGKEIRLADLFNPGSDYLQVISRFSVQKLEEELNEGKEDEWIRTGAGPEAKNFASWNFTKTGIEIAFDSYQVAAYAAGPQEARVPYDLLRPIFARSYSVMKAR